MKTKRIIKNKGRHARTKGHSFEREVAIAFRAVYPNARRHLEYQDGQCFGVDLAETGTLKIQCKKLKGYAPVNTIREIQCDTFLGDIPILITAADNRPAMVILPLDEFLRFLKSSSIR